MKIWNLYLEFCAQLVYTMVEEKMKWSGLSWCWSLHGRLPVFWCLTRHLLSPTQVSWSMSLLLVVTDLIKEE